MEMNSWFVGGIRCISQWVHLTGSTMTPALLLLLRVTFTILVFFVFCMNIRCVLCSSTRNSVGILIWAALNISFLGITAALDYSAQEPGQPDKNLNRAFYLLSSGPSAISHAGEI